MSAGIPLSNYHIGQIKKYGRIGAVSVAAIVLAVNIVYSIVKEPVMVDKKSYVMKNGFPIFVSQKEYINFIKKYPYDPGVKIKIHRIMQGESLWDVSVRSKVTIDTIIAANPFLKTLAAEEGVEIAVPEQDGVLVPFDDFIDILRMANMLNSGANGEYLPKIYKLVSRDDMRLAFFPGKRPLIVNDSLEKLYHFRNIFKSPLSGFYSSLFGERVNPFHEHGGTEFHNGIDIMQQMGAPIRPAREGMVISAGWRDGYGLTVVVQHYDGYVTLYSHFSAIKTEKGKWVTTDDVIGLVGSTGRSTGPHLHFTITRHGETLNPVYFIW